MKFGRLRRETALRLVASTIGIFLIIGLAPARAETATPQSRDALFTQTLKRPGDIALTLAYAQACEDLHDYEGAIGALERVLFYLPGDAEVSAHLGALYAALHSQQLAGAYLDAALANPRLDPAARASAEALRNPAPAQSASNQVFGSLQGGLRYQSNAAFNSDNNILRIAGQDYLFTHPQDRGADGNAFGIAQIGYDYDLGNERGDRIEFRGTGYGTAQFRLTDLDVGFYDLSVGPRLALAPDALPGVTIKPYVAGGQIFLAGQRYLASGGVGLVATIPLTATLAVQPGVEVRAVRFSDATVYSSLNSGSATTFSLAGEAALSDTFSLAGRLYYTRDSAAVGYQSADTFAEELALVARLPAALAVGSGLISLSPYVRFLQTRFDAANPYIDAAVVRQDNEYEFGAVVDAPLTRSISLDASIGYHWVASNIPNYSLKNLSILSGPTVRF